MKGIFVVPPSWPDGNRKILLAQLSTQRMGAPWPGYWGASERHPAKAGVAIRPQMMLEDVSHPNAACPAQKSTPRAGMRRGPGPRLPGREMPQAQVRFTHLCHAMNEPQSRELRSNLGKKSSDFGVVTCQGWAATSTGCETSSQGEATRYPRGNVKPGALLAPDTSTWALTCSWSGCSAAPTPRRLGQPEKTQPRPGGAGEEAPRVSTPALRALDTAEIKQVLGQGSQLASCPNSSCAGRTDALTRSPFFPPAPSYPK